MASASWISPLKPVLVSLILSKISSVKMYLPSIARLEDA